MKIRVLIATLMLVMAMAVVWSGGQTQSAVSQESALSAPGVFPIVAETEQVEIAVIHHQPFVTDMDTNDWWKYVESLTNIKVTWQPIPRPDVETRRQLLIAGGNYPDAAYGLQFSQAEVARLGMEGVFVPLGDLIEEHAPNLSSLLDSRPDVRAAITAPDGKIYNMPQFNECYHCTYQHKMWVRADWLENLGLSLPTTVDQFYDMLVAFATQDPNGNGIADEIPLSGAERGGWNTQIVGPFLMSPFVYTPDETQQPARLFLDNGVIRSAANQDGWREGLRFLNRLFEEGLLDEGALVQDKTQLIQLGENPDVAILGVSPAGYWNQFTEHGGPSLRYIEYVALPPLAGPAGRQATYTPQLPFGGFQVFTGAEDPALLVKWADIIYDETSRRNAWYGVEGLGWVEAGPNDKNVFGEPAKFRTLTVEGRNNYRFGWLGPFWASADIRSSGTTLPTDNVKEMFDRLTILDIATSEAYEPYGAPQKALVPVIMKNEDAAEVGALSAQIRTYINEMAARFIIGRSDLDEDWNAYLAELNRLGLPRLIEIHQSYQR